MGNILSRLDDSSEEEKIPEIDLEEFPPVQKVSKNFSP